MQQRIPTELYVSLKLFVFAKPGKRNQRNRDLQRSASACENNRDPLINMLTRMYGLPLPMTGPPVGAEAPPCCTLSTDPEMPFVLERAPNFGLDTC